MLLVSSAQSFFVLLFVSFFLVVLASGCIDVIWVCRVLEFFPLFDLTIVLPGGLGLFCVRVLRFFFVYLPVRFFSSISCSP